MSPAGYRYEHDLPQSHVASGVEAVGVCAGRLMARA